jgi:hypothetical protein
VRFCGVEKIDYSRLLARNISCKSVTCLKETCRNGDIIYLFHVALPEFVSFPFFLARVYKENEDGKMAFMFNEVYGAS